MNNPQQPDYPFQEYIKKGVVDRLEELYNTFTRAQRLKVLYEYEYAPDHKYLFLLDRFHGAGLDLKFPSFTTMLNIKFFMAAAQKIHVESMYQAVEQAAANEGLENSLQHELQAQREAYNKLEKAWPGGFKAMWD